jgi:hypothetical protein
MIPSQPSALLPSLFEHIDEERRLTVLNIGPALAETVEFFSRYRCKLHFIDLFGDLPKLVASEDATCSLPQLFLELMHIPPGTRFDICLFWDLFNFLDRAAIAALLGTLRPHLHSDSLGHGFAVHNLKTAQSGKIYGIGELDQITLRPRPAALPGYSPHNQGQLEKLLDCFRVTRSVLLAESRLELLLRAKLPA